MASPYEKLNAEDVVVCAHATESITTQRTGLRESLNKSVKFLLWVDKKNICIKKLGFFLFYASTMIEWIPLNSPEAVSDIFCCSWQLFEVQFTPWNSTGRNTVVFLFIKILQIFSNTTGTVLVTMSKLTKE